MTANGRRQIILYAAIGAITVTVDVVGFRWLVSERAVPELAAIASGLASMVMHFLLNKYVNFRKHDRPIGQQIGTYCAVVSIWWVVTLSVVALMTRVFMEPAIVAKLVAVVMNFPLGFLAQRHLTFGAGIGGFLRRRGSAS